MLWRRSVSRHRDAIANALWFMIIGLWRASGGRIFVGARVYPFLVSFGVAGVLLAAVRAVTYACLVAVFVLPVAAIVRRLIR